MAEREAIPTYLASYQDEIDSAVLYAVLAETEQQPQLAEVYRRLAAAEESHAQFWEQKLRAAGCTVPARRPSWRARALAWLARRFGPQFILQAVVGREQADRQKYDAHPEAKAAGLPGAEHSHARLLQAIAGSGPTGMEGGMLARLEGRHRAIGGNALRAAVLGANDGLVSNLSLVMGVAGADLSAHAILITGMAGLLAGSGSMAMGEWLSVQSARELYQRQIDIEAAEIELAPDEEREELALIYQAKGLTEEDARALATEIMGDRGRLLDTMSREELGIDPQELGGSAWEAAVTSFVLFAIGAIIPVTPFIFLTGDAAVVTSVAVSALALFVIGAAITLLTGRGVLFSGMRQLLIGMAAAALTYGVGRLIGASVGG